MKIAITADPIIPVPPLLYGGIERIIDLVIHGLIKQGHEVTLFAHKDSKVDCKLIPYKAAGNGFGAILLDTLTINKVLLTGKYDIVHSFGRLAYLLPQMPLNTPKLMSYQREPTVSQVMKAVKLSAKGTIAFTGCSNYITNKIKPYAAAHTVYNGIDISKYIATTKVSDDAPLVFLGRIEPIKGTHTAIQIALKTNKKLVIAGNISENEEGYFNEKISPFLNERITYIGPVNDRQKNKLLQNALALLMPIDWNEPFGIVMIEAMACGTPVIGFNKGAVPEVIENGITGFYGDTIDELIEKVSHVDKLDRKRIREITETRFSADVIVAQYIEIYRKMTQDHMRIVVSSPSVAPHVKQSVIAYYEAGYLERLYTTFIEHPDYAVSSFLNKFKVLQTETVRRSFHDLPIEKFDTRPLPELVRTAAARKLNRTIADQIWEWSELGFDKWVARKLNSKKIDVIHTYEHAALATLQKAKVLNLFSVYEQPSQHHLFFSSIAKKQMALYPELNGESAELLINEKADRRNKRRDAELKLASLVLCNSSFTKRTLIGGGVSPEKISVIPLAFPPVIPKNIDKANNEPLIFLYAGNQSLRKASHILYLAWRKCNFTEDEAILWLIGKMLLPHQLRQGLPGKVMIKENVPHTEMMQLYAHADVFVLPTLADGFGMVITEAMSQGIPVIASENSCGPDIIEHMKDGWIVPAGEVDALASQLMWCVNNRDKIAGFGMAASQKALSWQWPQYREKLNEIIFDKWQEFKVI